MTTNETPNPSCGKAALNFFAWAYLPYIMIFVRWKTLTSGRRLLGSIWALVMFIGLIGNLTNPSPSPTIADVPATRQPAVVRQEATDVPQPQQSAPTARTQVDPYTFETNRFLEEIAVVINRSSAATSVMRKYQNAQTTGYVMSDREAKLPVAKAYSEIQIIFVPSCRAEPAQIVESLYTIRDAQLAAFAEMGRQVDGRSTVDDAVREIENQLPTIDREVARIERLKDALE